MEKQRKVKYKNGFVPPSLEIFYIECNDIIVTSSVVDENQGEWDPQDYMSINNY